MKSAMESGKRYYVQSPFAFRKAGQSGADIAENWTHLAKVVDDAPAFIPTEMRPGNYVFLDRTQTALGAATLETCALFINATVVSRPAADRVILDCGAKTLALDGARGFSQLPGHGLVLLPDGTLQQRASPFSGLGQLMFDMNNKFEVYLHDTPGKELFKRPERRFSHGCIRVENPRELAALVMRQPISEIDQAIAKGDTVRTPIPTPVPVFVVYQTAFADSDGKLQFRPDVYGRDPAVWQALSPPGRALAQR